MTPLTPQQQALWDGLSNARRSASEAGKPIIVEIKNGNIVGVADFASCMAERSNNSTTHALPEGHEQLVVCPSDATGDLYRAASSLAVGVDLARGHDDVMRIDYERGGVSMGDLEGKQALAPGKAPRLPSIVFASKVNSRPARNGRCHRCGKKPYACLCK